MIQIAIVEDDPMYQKKILQYLRQYEAETGQHLHVRVFSDGADICRNYDDIYDIILMDIEMETMDGMTAAEQIRETDRDVIIIFITNMPQFVMQGYKVDAMDYVLKPIEYFMLSQRIDRALTRLRRREKKYLVINIKGGFARVEEMDIRYIEVRNHDLIYHTKNGEIITRKQLKEAEEELDARHFYRCHQKYLVNLEYVTTMNSEFLYIGKHAVPISRSKRKGLLDAMNDYIIEERK